VPHVDDWEIKGSDDTYVWMEHTRPCALRDLGRLSEGTVLGRWNATLRCGGRPRSDRASRRWTDYIVARPEVSILAYEFTTGTGWRGRQERHATWLAELARNVGRPMHLVVRGGIDVLPTLIGAFARINIIDTSSFVKAVKRRRVFVKEGRLSDSLSPTAIGQPVDTLFRENVETIGTWLQHTIKSAQHDLNANKIQEESLLVRAEMVNA
jgi:hypothetical protein